MGPGFDQILPSTSGAFDRTFPFQSFSYQHPVPILSPLLDGKAGFHFSAFGGILIATTYVTSFPQVTVNTATLMIEGQGLASLPGDYNVSGIVDTADFAIWQDSFGSTQDLRADGNRNGIVDGADYTVWRDHMHGSGAGGGVSVGAIPEPSTALFLTAAAIVALSRRSHRLMTAAA